MNFEIFEPARSNPPGRGVPTLRIVSGGRLILNAAATRMIGDVERVQLLWDATNRRIGIKPAPADAQVSFKVVRTPSQAVITSKEFVTTHRLAHNQRMRLEWDGSMWIAAEPSPPRTDPR